MREGETELTIRMPIYKKPKNGIVSISPDFHVNITLKTIEESKTGVTMKLPDFMDTRYQYNDRISDNEYKIVNTINA